MRIENNQLLYTGPRPGTLANPSYSFPYSFEYELDKQNKTLVLKKYIDSGHDTITIPDTWNGYDVYVGVEPSGWEYTTNVFENSPEEIKKIIFGKDLTPTYRIGLGSLRGLNDTIESITLGNNNFSGSFFYGQEISLPNLKEVIFLDDAYVTNNFEVLPQIEKVVVPNTVTEISDNKFYQNVLWYQTVQLKEIILPNTITRIGERAFFSCHSLEKINLSESPIVEIGSGAFGECRSLRYIVLPNNLNTLGNSCFWDTAIQEIILPNSINTINGSTFMGCSSLAKVTILYGNNEQTPGNTLTIGGNAFTACTNLTELILPQYLQNISIGSSAFSYSGLTNGFYFPSNINYTVETTLFEECQYLTDIYVPWTQADEEAFPASDINPSWKYGLPSSTIIHYPDMDNEEAE